MAGAGATTKVADRREHSHVGPPSATLGGLLRLPVQIGGRLGSLPPAPGPSNGCPRALPLGLPGAARCCLLRLVENGNHPGDQLTRSALAERAGDLNRLARRQRAGADRFATLADDTVANASAAALLVRPMTSGRVARARRRSVRVTACSSGSATVEPLPVKRVSRTSCNPSSSRSSARRLSTRAWVMAVRHQATNASSERRPAGALSAASAACWASSSA